MMAKRTIWLVGSPDGSTLTVIAESRQDAIVEAATHCDDIDGDHGGYFATLAPPLAPIRWVGFESSSDMWDRLRDIESAGVALDQILTRTTSQPGVSEVLWEVGARDSDWCRLPAGVLCGGG